MGSSAPHSPQVFHRQGCSVETQVTTPSNVCVYQTQYSSHAQVSVYQALDMVFKLGLISFVEVSANCFLNRLLAFISLLAFPAVKDEWWHFTFILWIDLLKGLFGRPRQQSKKPSELYIFKRNKYIYLRENETDSFRADIPVSYKAKWQNPRKNQTCTHRSGELMSPWWQSPNFAAGLREGNPFLRSLWAGELSTGCINEPRSAFGRQFPLHRQCSHHLY